MCAFKPTAPLAPTTTVSDDKVIISWSTPTSDGGSPFNAYSVYIRDSNLVYTLEATYCDSSIITAIMTSTRCTVPFTTLRSSTFNLILGNSVLAKIVASNVYGSSDPSPEGSGAVIQYVPDAPINVANDLTITSATRVGLTWVAGSSTGGSPIVDYTINYS